MVCTGWFVSACVLWLAPETSFAGIQDPHDPIDEIERRSAELELEMHLQELDFESRHRLLELEREHRQRQFELEREFQERRLEIEMRRERQKLELRQRFLRELRERMERRSREGQGDRRDVRRPDGNDGSRTSDRPRDGERRGTMAPPESRDRDRPRDEPRARDDRSTPPRGEDRVAELGERLRGLVREHEEREALMKRIESEGRSEIERLRNEFARSRGEQERASLQERMREAELRLDRQLAEHRERLTKISHAIDELESQMADARANRNGDGQRQKNDRDRHP